MNLHRQLVSILFFFVIHFASAQHAKQIDVHINANNPRFPFPQFLDYTKGKTLANDNPVGVTHLEMERDVREAYQIMMNRASYEGSVVAGTKYIIYNAEGLGGSDGTGPVHDCTEGDGYSLLAAAYMADKPTFDGIFMYVHDNKRSIVEYFSKCGEIRNPDYKYGKGIVGWKIGENDGAADGDYDIGMALLIAYLQWPNDGIVDDCGKLRTYKELATEFLVDLTDTTLVIENKDLFNPSNWSSTGGVVPDPLDLQTAPWGGFSGVGLMSGYIGWDGYPRIANTCPDVSNFIGSHPQNIFKWKGKNWYTYNFKFTNSKSNYFDYNAPSYFRSFADFLEKEDPLNFDFHIYQYRRAAASTDWLMGESYKKGYYPTAGTYTVNADGSSTSFEGAGGTVDSEDSRNPWRTILNYVWHDHPDYSWDPATHEVIPGLKNTFEADNAMRWGQMVEGWYNDLCLKPGNDPTALEFSGPILAGSAIDNMSGSMTTGTSKFLNWYLGTGSAGIVAYHDSVNNDISRNMIRDWYRRLVLMWDASDEGYDNPDERYINSLPIYFHGWFRTLGMLIVTGNYQSPEFMSSPIKANLKVYNAVDKTVAYGPTIKNGKTISLGDIVTHTLSYRNYSSEEAKNGSITFTIPDQYSFVTATGSYTQGGNKITWDIGDVPGYKSLPDETGKNWKKFDPTQYDSYGEVELKLRVNDGYTGSLVETYATITADNVYEDFTSNEYPNNYTSTMERNLVDIGTRSLEIVKRADLYSANDGDIITFDVEFANSSKIGWLNGGRPDVCVTYVGTNPGDYTLSFLYRVLHGADEAYINPGNYRVSYFINDAARLGLYNAQTNKDGWAIETLFVEGGDEDKVEFSSQKYTTGEDAEGKWNQRLIVEFPDTLMPSTGHTNMYFAKAGEGNEVKYVHKGAAAPFRMMVKMEALGGASGGCTLPIKDLITDDWSYPGTLGSYNDKSLFIPISPSWFDPHSSYDETLSKPVTKYHPDACNPPVTEIYDRLLIEEYDGYVWRRVLGRGPVPGRELMDVYVVDTLPEEFEWQGFVKQEALGVKAQYDASTHTVRWKVPAMLPGASGRLSYAVKAKLPVCDTKVIESPAWIGSSSDSPIDSAATVVLTCDDVIKIHPTNSTIYKTVDKKKVTIDDIVKYTVSFMQSDGTISEPDLSSSNDWTVHCGAALSSFKATQNRTFTYDYSHGTNGTLEAKVVPARGQTFALVFRHEGGSGCGSGLEVQLTNNECAQLDVELFENGTSIGSRVDMPYASPADTMNIKVELFDDEIKIWVNNFSALPYIFKNISHIRPGYVGFKNPGTEKHELLSWRTNFDSGFEVSIIDEMPSNIELDQSSISVLYDEAGTYSNPIDYNNTDKLSWVLVEDKTPMLYGDSVSFEFEAKFKTCGTNKYTSNVARAKVMGQHVNAIVGVATVECSVEGCNIPSTVSVTPSSDSISCDGSDVSIAISTNGTDTYGYMLYKGSLKKDENTLSEFSISESGSYIVRVTDPADPATCYLESSPIDITIESDPGVSVTSSATQCHLPLPSILLEAEVGGTAHTGGTWYVNESAITGDRITIDDYGRITVEIKYETDNGGTCLYADSLDMTIGGPDVPVADKASYSTVLGGTNPDMTLSGDATADFYWYASLSDYENGNALSSGAVYQSAETADGKYTYYFAQEVSGCRSAVDSVIFTITDCPVTAPVVRDTSLCISEGSASLTLAELESLAEHETGITYTVTDDAGTELAFDQTFSAAADVTFLIYGTGTCDGPSSEIKVTVLAEPVITRTMNDTVCFGIATPIDATVDGLGTGTWEYLLNGNPHSLTDIDPERDGMLSAQANTLTAIYTAPSTEGGCSAKLVMDDIRAFLPDTPTVADISVNIQSLPHPALSAVGTGNVTWLDVACGAEIATGNTFDPQYTETTIINAVQEISGCKSECNPVTITINACDLVVPILDATDTLRICKGDALPSATILNPQTGYTYLWGGTTGTETYQFTQTLPGTYTVALQVEKDCTMDGPEAVLVIEELPEPKISLSETTLCGGSGTAQAIFTPALNVKSSFFVGADQQANAKNGEFSLVNLVAGTIDLTYNYVSAAGCSAQDVLTVPVTVAEAPSSLSKVEIISEPMDGLLAPAGVTGTINWYGPNDPTVFISSAASTEHTDRSATGTWTYYFTRTISGCESPAATFTYEITDCKMPAPIVSLGGIDGPNFKVCTGKDAVLTAAQADTASKVSWYSADGTPLLDDPAIYTAPALTEGKHSYYATQTGTCEGARFDFTIEAISVSIPQITMPAETAICQGQAIPEFIYSGSDTPQWTDALGQTVGTSGKLTVSPTLYQTGTNKYTLITTKVATIGVCQSDPVVVEFDVTAYPAVPTVTKPTPVCQGEPFSSATATGAGDIIWMQFPATAKVASGTIYAPQGTAISSVSYYAQQAINGCASPEVEVKFEVYDAVLIPEVDDNEMCHQGALISFAPENIRPEYTAYWEDAGGNQYTGSTFTPDTSILNSRKNLVKAWYKSNNGCISKKGDFTFGFIRPEIPTLRVDVDKVCSGDKAHFTAPSMSSIDGYSLTTPAGDLVSTLPYSAGVGGEYSLQSFIYEADGDKCFSNPSEKQTLTVLDQIDKPEIVVDSAICQASISGKTLVARSIDGQEYKLRDEYGNTQSSTDGVFSLNKLNLSPGMNLFTVWTEEPCPSAEAEVSITINENPSAPEAEKENGIAGINGTAITVCESIDVAPADIYFVSSGARVSWEGENLSGSDANGKARLTVPFPNNQGDLFIFTAQAEFVATGCQSDEVLFQYTIKGLPEDFISGYALADTICLGSAEKVYLPEGKYEGYAYSWSANDEGVLNVQSGDGIALVTPLTRGTEQLNMYIKEGNCENKVSINVTVVEKPEPDFRIVADAYTGGVKLYNQTIQPLTEMDEIPVHFNWEFEDGTLAQSYPEFMSNAPVRWQFEPGEQSITLTAYNSGGEYCIASKRKEFYMELLSGLFVPTSFSPRMAGTETEFWKPAGFNLAKYEVWIHDYWGNLVWYSNALNDGKPAEAWYGRDSKGNVVDGDVFTYRIEAKFRDGGVWKNSAGKKMGSIIMLK